MDNDEQRDYAEEAYNRDLCPACGDSPCSWDGKPDGFHADDADENPKFTDGELAIWQPPGDHIRGAKPAPGRTVRVRVRYEKYVTLNLPDGWKYDAEDPDTGRILLFAVDPEHLTLLTPRKDAAQTFAEHTAAAIDAIRHASRADG